MSRANRILRPNVWLAGLLMLGIGGAEPPRAPAPPPAGAKPVASKEQPAITSMKEPLALIARAQAAYAKVRDYSCTLVKREKLGAKLSPNHVIALKVKTSPFSVSMRWQEPKSLDAQEVCYVAGKNDGNMRVRLAGLLGAIGFVSVSPDDERARRTSRHRITEAGLGWLIQQFATGWKVEEKLGKTQVRIGAYQYAKRRCTRVELTHTSNEGGRILHYRNVLYFDQQNDLPIRVENYDWPKKPGQPAELVEVYSYVNLRLNIGVPDAAFDH
jgi:hypothetical protein